jgi:hypothetical protein
MVRICYLTKVGKNGGKGEMGAGSVNFNNSHNLSPWSRKRQPTMSAFHGNLKEILHYLFYAFARDFRLLAISDKKY